MSLGLKQTTYHGFIVILYDLYCLRYLFEFHDNLGVLFLVNVLGDIELCLSTLFGSHMWILYRCLFISRFCSPLGQQNKAINTITTTRRTIKIDRRTWISSSTLTKWILQIGQWCRLFHPSHEPQQIRNCHRVKYRAFSKTQTNTVIAL